MTIRKPLPATLDTGLCWRLQGWFGRTATQLIEDGVIHRKS